MLLLLAVGCKPDFGAPLSLITTPRLIAVRAEPAEAAPGAMVTMAALAASPDGTVTPAPAIDWSACTTPKPIAENGAVAASCLAAGGTTALGDTAAPLPVVLPADGCSLFGPELPPETAGEMLQPRAPDITGGYFQPLRADFAGEATATIGLVRIRCPLAGASLAAATAFAAQYTNNVNPMMTTVSATVDGAAVALDALPAGRDIVFSAGWTAASPEHYPVFDADTQALVDHREAMTVAWYANAGAFATERTGRAENDATLFASNTWTAPVSAGPAHLWLVLTDSRGGVDFADVALVIVN